MRGWDAVALIGSSIMHVCPLNTPRRSIADSIALDAVWPRPQIEASRIACPISAISASSSSTVPRVRPDQQPRERLLLAHGADAARHALAAALVAEERRDDHQQPPRSTVSSSATTTPEPSVAPAARVSSNVSGRSSSSGVTKPPAAPPSSTARSVRPGETPPASSSSSRSVVPNGTS